MFRGTLSFKKDELGKLPNSSFFLQNVSLENFQVQFTLSLNRNFQIIAIKRDETVTVINAPYPAFPQVFSSREYFFDYLKTHKNCEKFSVVYYDENLTQLSFIRDLFGLRPLFYRYVSDHQISFSSSIPELLKVGPRIPLKLNSKRISQYLGKREKSSRYCSGTLFDDIKSVLPGEIITFSRSNIVTDYFLTFNTNISLIKNKEEYGEEFKHLFKNSIKSCLSSGGKLIIGSQLSGGLDSSSITATLRTIQSEIDLHTFYANTSTTLTSEDKYANEVASWIKSIHHIVVPKKDHIDSAYQHISLYGHPDFMVNGPSLNKSIIKTAVNFHCDTLFSGHAGDAIVGYGGEYVRNLFLSGQWNILKSILNSPLYENLTYLGTTKANKSNAAKTIYSIIASNKNEYSNLQLLKLITECCRYFEIPFNFFVKSLIRKVVDATVIPKSISRKVTSNNIQQHSLKPNLTDMSEISEIMYDTVFDVTPIMINEQFYHLDNYYGIQHEFPFYNKLLFELNMQVPSEIKYDFGKKRGHLREAMKGILPERVRNRTTKANFGLYSRSVALEFYEQSRDLLTIKSPVWEFVIFREFKQSIKLLYEENQPLYIYNLCLFNVLKTINLAIWLDIFSKPASNTNIISR